MSDRKQPPIKTFRAGGVWASIWANESRSNGQTTVQHRVQIEKRYFHRKKQQWRSSTYFYPEDLPNLRSVTDQALACFANHEIDRPGYNGSGLGHGSDDAHSAVSGDEFIDRSELARRLGLHEQTTRRMVERGELPRPCMSVGGRPRWLWRYVLEHCTARHRRTENSDPTSQR